jgi:glutathione S-transferase
VPEVTYRYFKEVSRIYGVLNRRLEGRPYFAGDEYTIADIAVENPLRKRSWTGTSGCSAGACHLLVADNPNSAAQGH